MNVSSPPPVVPAANSRLRPTRRNFLIGTGAVAGLAVAYVVWPRSHPLNWVAAPDEKIINGFVKIGTDGRVVVAIPQAEMGQGVSSALAQVVADELGADWNTVSVEPAPLHPIYANRGMTLDMTAAMPASLQGFARWGLGGVIEHFDLQMTGGSTSVRGFAAPMRLAGAAAREMLCQAAARDWGADWTQCTTDNGFVVYKANRVRFADIAGKVVAGDAPSSPTLRTSTTLMGKPLPRIDIPAKTDGSARFGIDVRVPGMVYAAVRSGPAGDAALVSADDTKARAMPGVIDIVHGPTWVAAVATTWWGASKALDAVVPVFAPQAHPAGPSVSDAPRLALAATDAKAVRNDGDAAGALAKGAVITADYTVPYLAHAALEPMNATAHVVERQGRGLGPDAVADADDMGGGEGARARRRRGDGPSDADRRRVRAQGGKRRGGAGGADRESGQASGPADLVARRGPRPRPLPPGGGRADARVGRGRADRRVGQPDCGARCRGELRGAQCSRDRRRAEGIGRGRRWRDADAVRHGARPGRTRARR